MKISLGIFFHQYHPDPETLLHYVHLQYKIIFKEKEATLQILGDNTLKNVQIGPQRTKILPNKLNVP